jgi:hypothetical protein
MNLLQSTLLTGLILLIAGIFIAAKPKLAEPAMKAFPRSRAAALLVFGSASLWFLFVYVATLGPADFGEHRNLLFAGFALIAVLAFFYVADFLAVRGLAALLLLYAALVLDSAFGMPQNSRLFLVAVIYLSIFLALYLAAVPYRLRDFFNWLFGSPQRPRILGGMTGAYGLLLLITAFTY